jgi:hypothetical protein
MYVAGLEIHHNDLEIVTQAIILIVLESGFLHRPCFVRSDISKPTMAY